MNLIFGHKDLPQRKHATLGELVADKSFDLSRAEVYRPFVEGGFTEVLDNTKQSAQTYLDSAFDFYTIKTKESFRASIIDSNLAIKRRYDELLSDVLDISDRFGKGAEFEKIQRYIFLKDTLGIFIPNLIKDYIVDPRNDLEHEFALFTEDDALKAYEIARLFVDYTSKYLSGSLIREVEIGFRKYPIKIDNGLTITFGKNTSNETSKRFLFVYKENGSDTGDYFLMNSKHNEYLNLLIALCSEKEINSTVIKDILTRL